MTRHSTIAKIAFSSIDYSSDPLSFFRRLITRNAAPPSSSKAPAIMAGSSHRSLSIPSATLLLFGTLISMA